MIAQGHVCIGVLFAADTADEGDLPLFYMTNVLRGIQPQLLLKENARVSIHESVYTDSP